MRKIKLSLAMSLDGYIEGPNGEYDWCFTDQDYGLSEFFSSVDTIFYGRKSYELFANMPPSENMTEMESGVFGQMAAMKKYVFSSTLKYADGAEIINGSIEEKINGIRQQPGKDIFLFGGTGLITTLENLDMIDEYMLALHPIVLGAGKPVFMDIKERKKLKLTYSKVYSTGLIMLYYQPDRKD